MLDKIQEKLSQNQVLKDLKLLLETNKFCDSFYLTGGAVIDILKDKKPKDFDIYTTTPIVTVLEKSQDVIDLKLLYTSRTAITFLYKNETTIQILKRPPESFKFTIEQSKYNIKKERLDFFCLNSYLSKQLIPNDLVFESKEVTKKDFKLRLRKWGMKGFHIHEVTKKSYLKWAKDTSLFSVIKDYLRPKSDEEYES